MTGKTIKVITTTGIIALIVLSIGFLFLNFEQKPANPVKLQESQLEVVSFSTVNDISFPEFTYRNEGYNNLSDWWTALKEKRNSFEGSADKASVELDGYLGEEDKSLLYSYELNIIKANNLTKLQENEVLFNEIVERVSAEKIQAEKIQAEMQTSQQQTDSGSGYADYSAAISSGDYSGSYYDFLRDGIANSNGNKFSYYSQGRLPGGGLNIPDRHVDGGFVKDADGYIVLANDDPNGTVIDTPWGPGKVYDKGTSGNHYDVYVE